MLAEPTCWRALCQNTPPPSRARRSHPQRFSATGGRDGTATDQRSAPPALIETAGRWENATRSSTPPDLPAACRGFKKKTPALTPPGMRRWADARSRPVRVAGLSATKSTASACGGATTRRQSCWWPLVSWVAPANVSRRRLARAQSHYCDRRWSWWPRQVVADMGLSWPPKANAGVESVGAVRHHHPFALGHEAGSAFCERTGGGVRAGAIPGVARLRMCGTISIGLGCDHPSNCATVVGKPAPVRASSLTHRRS